MRLIYAEQGPYTYALLEDMQHNRVAVVAVNPDYNTKCKLSRCQPTPVLLTQLMQANNWLIQAIHWQQGARAIKRACDVYKPL